MPLVEDWEAERSLDYYCLYASVFPLPVVAFPCSLVGLESRPFLSLSVTIYYFSIENLTSDESPFAPSIPSSIPE